MVPIRVGVIGAGVSGLVCAQTLTAATSASKLIQVSVIEYGRGPGGRTARRRVQIQRPGGEAAEGDGEGQGTTGSVEVGFDHAAPYFSATSDSFKNGLLRTWTNRGIAAPWSSQHATSSGASGRISFEVDDGGQSCWVGVPTNHSICRALASDIASSATAQLLYGRYVTSASYDAALQEWRVECTVRGAADAAAAKEQHVYDALVLSDKLLVVPNAYAVLAPGEVGGLALETVEKSEQVVVLMVALKSGAAVKAQAEVPWGVMHFAGSDVLARVIHESDKPGRANQDGELDLWVAHSTQQYADKHITADTGEGPGLDDEDGVLREMQATFLQEVFQHTGGTDSAPAIVSAKLMTWDHAQSMEDTRLEDSFVLDAERNAGVCGDLFLKGSARGVEAAALSGERLAQAMLQGWEPQERRGDQREQEAMEEQPSTVDRAPDSSLYPAEPVAALRRKQEEAGLSVSSKALCVPVPIGGRADVVTNMRLVGVFPTRDWTEDPAMPPFVPFHDYRIGHYCVADCDVTDGSGMTLKLTLVINDGDGDCNSGYWGAAFERDAPHRVAVRFRSSGDTETTVGQVDNLGFIGHDDSLVFPKWGDEGDYGDEEPDEDQRGDFFSGLAPGFCTTQFEKILGVAMQQMMRAKWRSLPKSLRNYGDAY